MNYFKMACRSIVRSFVVADSWYIFRRLHALYTSSYSGIHVGRWANSRRTVIRRSSRCCRDMKMNKGWKKIARRSITCRRFLQYVANYNFICLISAIPAFSMTTVTKETRFSVSSLHQLNVYDGHLAPKVGG